MIFKSAQWHRGNFYAFYLNSRLVAIYNKDGSPQSEHRVCEAGAAPHAVRGDYFPPLIGGHKNLYEDTSLKIHNVRHLAPDDRVAFVMQLLETHIQPFPTQHESVEAYWNFVKELKSASNSIIRVVEAIGIDHAARKRRPEIDGGAKVHTLTVQGVEIYVLCTSSGGHWPG